MAFLYPRFARRQVSSNVRCTKMNEQSKVDLAMQAIKRRRLQDDLRSSLEQSIDQRVDRYLEINHQWIIGNHYFAAASAECIKLYRDGYFISTVMVSQAVNEGIFKFVAERNSIARKSHEQLIKELMNGNIISEDCAEASKRIWGSFRNDLHHMNPKVATIPFEALAKRNLQDLSVIEKEIFDVDVNNGKLIPHQPKYWDVQNDGTVPTFLRSSF